MSNHANQSRTNGADTRTAEQTDAEPCSAEQFSAEPLATYNIKAVVQETGLKSVTIRSWERRYDLPQPQRTKGGHRQYTQRDVDILKWLMARQAEGISIGHATSMWHKQVAQGIDPLQSPQAVTPPPADAVPAPIGKQMDVLRSDWIDACKSFDRKKAGQTLTQAFSLFPLETVCFELLQKGIAQIGVDWVQGNATVQQEHFASAVAAQRLDLLLAATPPPTRAERIIVACAPEDPHTFSPLLLSLLLARRGWDVVYLGADVPAADLDSTVAEVEPALVVLSAQRLPAAANLLDVAARLQPRNALFGYGGRIFNRIPSLPRLMPGYFLGETLQGAPAVIQELIETQPSAANPSTPPLPRADGQAQLDYFLMQRPQIEAHVWQKSAVAELSTTQVDALNRDLAQFIIAALKFGDIDILQHGAGWIEQSQASYGLRLAEIRRFLTVYRQAAQRYLQQHEVGLLDWLASLTAGIAPSLDPAVRGPST